MSLRCPVHLQTKTYKRYLAFLQRSRRIAKEVAIDYVRRYLDGEEERVDVRGDGIIFSNNLVPAVLGFL